MLLHLAASVDPAIPVIFIDTGKIFGSTHRYRDEVVALLGLTDVRIARPDPGVLDDAGHRFRPVAARSRQMLRDPQGRAAVARALRLRRLDLRPQALPGRAARAAAAGRGGRRPHQDQSARRMVEGRHRRLSQRCTICPSTRSSPTASARSAACPAPRASPKARTSATAAGAATDKTECGIHLGLAAFETDGSGI